MLLLFQVCFFVGLGLVILSFIAGSLLDFLGIDGIDLDLDMFGPDISLPLSPRLLILFVTVFGGIGWILMNSNHPLSAFLIILIAAASGLAASLLFQIAIIIPLKKAENTSAPDTEELIGVLARVTERVPEKGFGEITYIVNGNSYTAPAKSTTGEAIKKGDDVSICWIEEHIFYVANIDL